MSSIRMLVALASLQGMHIHQMDVKTAFLNGDLNEEVYMRQPEGFVVPGQEDKVCRLVKSLYGLKQAPKQWHEKFDSTVVTFGFKHNSADRCVYTRVINGHIIIICLYVDDMLIIGSDLNAINETKAYLSSVFQMKDLGKIDVVLGIKVRQTSGGFALTQSHYIEKVLTKFEHLGIKEFNTPFDPSVKLDSYSGKAVSQLEYASAIGCMMYAMHCTRPDIAFAVGKLSRFTSCPGPDHWTAIGRVLGYLKRTSSLELRYGDTAGTLEGFADASWNSGSADCLSTSGWIFRLAGGAVSWSSKKQTCLTYSTMEAEFVALCAAGQEAQWIRDFITDVQPKPNPIPSLTIYCDSEAALSRAYNTIYNGKSRFVRIRHEIVRQLITNGTITLVYVRSSRNLADPLTKALTRDLVKTTTEDMGLKPQKS